MPESTTSQVKDTAGGLVRVASAAGVWGTIPLVLSVVAGVPSLVIVFWRVTISGAAMLLVTAIRPGGFAEFASMPRRRFLALAANGVLLALNWVLFFSGLRLAGVAVGEMLGYLGPVFVAALAPLLLRQRFDVRVVLPLALALGGTAVILASTVQRTAYGPNVPLGAALAAGSSLTYSLLILNSKRILEGTGAAAVMTAENIVAAVVLLPAALLLPGPSAPREWAALGVLALVHTVGSGMLFMSGLKRVRAEHAAILTYAEPVSAVGFAAVFLGQPVTVAIVAGAAAVVAGGVLVARSGVGFGQEAPTWAA